MFSKCLFCHAALGKNDQLETFPIGRRVAYDPKKGRLWVICRRCKRWNLSPLEERWEAIETSERAVRDMHPVKRSERIALFRHPSGLEWVRLGEPTWRETATWRYGTPRRTRWMRQTTTTNRVVAAANLTVLSISLFGIVGPFVTGAVFALGKGLWELGVERRVVARVPTIAGDMTGVQNRHLRGAFFAEQPSADVMRLGVMTEAGLCTLEGGLGLRVLGHALVRANRMGADEDEVHASVERVAESASPAKFLASEIRAARLHREGYIARIPRWTRYALEIAAQEELERHAWKGELATLEQMWKDADELAAISDNLLVPDAITQALRRLKGER